MAQKTVKIKLSRGGVQFKRNATDGIEICVCGLTRNGRGKWHEITIIMDRYDMRHITESAKKWARNEVKTAKEFLDQLNQDPE